MVLTGIPLRTALKGNNNILIGGILRRSLWTKSSVLTSTNESGKKAGGIRDVLGINDSNSAPDATGFSSPGKQSAPSIVSDILRFDKKKKKAQKPQQQNQQNQRQQSTGPRQFASSSTSPSVDTDLILGRSLSRPIGDHPVRCTVFDPHGNVSVVSGEFRRSELLLKHGLLPRDLRKLDTGISSIVPSILVRQNSILVNLLHIRALVKADMVLLFDAYGSTDSKTQSIFMYDLEHKLRHGSKTMGGLPYELRALEAIFISVVSALDAEMQVHTMVVNGILAELEDDIDREKLRHLLIQSKKLSSFFQKATLIRDTIDELLEQDEDLAGLYLTAKMNGNPIAHDDDHSEVEMLLESYYKHCDEIVQTVGSLISNIRSTEEIINIILDSNRNSLMLLDLKFQIGTLGLGGGAFIASLYGMNLQNFIEETDWGFWSVSGVVGLSSVIIILICLKHLRKVQRVTMMSDQPKLKIHGKQAVKQQQQANYNSSNGSLWSWLKRTK
ncbi:Mrs2p [Sugiyamaella lignohabitans]|uniref:Magnesium transporter n=1 Tax=Sugiyamaella lignohabitans TaxID=796027 RepID=A0A167DX59_9ASCO|nr:Mrs2p [Sugiyamaella lignohabitans]ANB13401.1 Mrs2p [Sugiyamaella lignohabitans]